MSDFKEAVLKRNLGSLSRDKQLAFALLLCDRMKPALDKFASETSFNGAVYQACLDNAWLHLAGNTSLSNYREMAEKCLDAAPDTEEFDHPLTSEALNEALSIAATMSFLADHSVDYIVEAARLARDTASFHAQEVGATPPLSLVFKEIMAHPLVQQELQRQRADLKFLESLRTAAQQMVTLIRAHASRTSRLIPTEN
jgi:uncharacterized protein YjaG (DUF416 family)